MPKLTLSFDTGPVPGATERILEILAGRGLKASFFLIGERLRDPACRRLAERTKDEGHWIGNHTMTHTAPLTQLSDPNHAEAEIGRCQEMLGALSHPMRFFRPSGGGTLGPHLLTRSAVDYLIANQFTVVTWNDVPGDFIEPRRRWLERACQSVPTRPWTLIILHDHALADMMDTLPTFLDRMEDAGVAFTQDFPEECVPIRQGKVMFPLDGLMTEAPATKG
jgi:peptidoglycan/xylan/chitin deacetylase (PgdA/CDA1 family)